MRTVLVALLALAALAASPWPAALRPPAAHADSEADKHGDDAARPLTTLDEEVNGVRVRQYQLGCLSQLTYLIVSEGEAAVVDPQRDVAHYVADAESLGARIAAVLLTHTNADFVAGHTELANRGAKIYISKESGSEFVHEPLQDGSRIAVGRATVEAWATPGHTLDAMTFLLHVPASAVQPSHAFTGDTLFIGGIGRPDLVGGEATPMRLAGLAFDSMTRLRTLPDAMKILPAHGAGSLCGAHLAPETVSTLGAQRTENPYLADMSRSQFVSRVITGLPVAPAYFQHNARLNREGPPIVDRAPELPPALEPQAVEALARRGAWLVDLRDAQTYAVGHVEGAVNVAVRGRLDTWMGTVVPFDAELVLIGSDDEVREAAFRFRRIGLDRIAGHLAGGMAAWRDAGLSVRTTELWSPARLAEAVKAGREPIIVDVRTESEAADVRIGDYALIPLAEWERFGKVLDRAAPVLFLCNSAYRSSMAVGLAERLGFAAPANLEGGLDAWLSAGLPTIGSATIVSQSKGTAAAPGAATRVLLPEAIAPTALAAQLMDQPKAWALLDLRQAWAYDEYHVPGATRVEWDDLLAYVRDLDPVLRIVLLDRDGLAAQAAAGAVMALLPGRHVRVLAGGTAAFWREVELAGGAAAPHPMPAAQGAGSPAAGPTTPAAVPAAPAAPAAPAPKKRPAGC